MLETRESGRANEAPPFLRPSADDLKRRHAAPGIPRTRLAAGAALGLAALALAHLALRSPLLAVRSVGIFGAERLGAATLQPATATLRGKNLLAADLGGVEARLKAASPWVAAATARRVLPDRIEIEVVEKTPVGRLSASGALLGADASSLPAEPVAAGDLSLPGVITTIPPAPETLRRVADLLAVVASGRAPLAGRLASVDATDPDDLVILLTDVPYAVHIGEGDFKSRLNRFHNTEPLLRARYEGLEIVDLRFRDRVVVSPVARVERGASGG